MIADLKPYPAVQDSRVPWLGEVPAHWELPRLKTLFRAEDIRSTSGTETLLSLRRDYGVVKYDEHFSRPSQGASLVGFKLVRTGQFVVNRLQANNGLVFHSTLDGLVSPDYSVFEPRKAFEPDFLEAMLRTPQCRAHFRRESTGLGTGSAGFLRLYDDRFLETRVAMPPLDEQTAIVRFLDHADRRIRRYIRAKQKLIKLLEEQKQAIIHRVVTRGLDSNVRLKPSGVEWLGDVPEHWEVVRLGRLIDLATGFPFKSEGFTQGAEDIRLLRGVNISPGKIRWNNVVRWPQSERDNYNAFELRVGDIVLGMDRPIIQSGTRVATVSEADVPALLLQRVGRIRPKDELRSEFLTLLLTGKSFADYLTPIFTGISVPHLSPEQIRSFYIALPTDSEQWEIVRWTAEKTRKIRAPILGAEREIELLREYRTRLIADVVTGKIDVLEAAARLPKDVDEAGQLDETESELDSEDVGEAVEGVGEEIEA